MRVSVSQELVDQIHQCSELYIVLKNRYGKGYVESYKLPFVIAVGDQFWGKFQNVHAIDKHMGVSVSGVGAYLYNNFSNVVRCSYFQEKMERFYSLKAYSYVEFGHRNQYEKIYDSANSSSID